MSLAFLRDMRRPAPCEAELRALRIAQAAHDERRVGHRARNDAQHAGAGRRRAFAVDDQLAALVAFFPGEVVVVLDARDDFGAQQFRHQSMDHRVVRGRVFAHEIHRQPVFLAGLAVEARARPAGQGPCSASASEA